MDGELVFLTVFGSFYTICTIILFILTRNTRAFDKED